MLKYIRQWVFKIDITHATKREDRTFPTTEGFLSLLCPHQNLTLTLRPTTILISIIIDSFVTWASTSYAGNYISTLLYLTLFAELRHSHISVWVSVFSFYYWAALIMWKYQYFIAVVVLVTRSCPTLCSPINYTQLASSVHGSLQARILEWAAIPFFRGSSWPRDRTWVSCIAGEFFTIWAPYWFSCW